MKLPTLFGLLAAIATFGSMSWHSGGGVPRAEAIDCTVRHDLYVEIRQIDRLSFFSRSLLSDLGAVIDVDRVDPQVGTVLRTRPAAVGVRDNGHLDASPELGLIKLEDLCSASEGEYRVTLTFDKTKLSCDLIDGDKRDTGLLDDNTIVRFLVRRCATVEPTPVPTATPIPPTATPQPTATAVQPTTIFAEPPTPVVLIVPIQQLAAPTAIPTVQVPAPASSLVIRPPATGDGGLK